MTSGAPWKHILSFSFPIIAGALLQQLYQTADSIIVGNFVGENSLAAVGTTNTLTFFSLSAALGISAVSGVLISRYFGAGDEKKMRLAVFPAAVALTALSLRVSVTYLLKDGELFGYRIIWWKSLFGYSTGCLLTWLYYRYGKWRTETPS